MMRITAVLLLLCLLPACATDRSLDDLRLVSVRAIAQADKPRLHFIAPSDEPLLAIEFSTGEDLIASAQDRNSMIQGRVFFCENERTLRIEGDLRVYDRKGAIESTRQTPTTSITRLAGRQSYVVAVRAKVETPINPGAIAYDLKIDSRDLCLILRGGNVLGRTIASNTLRIPSTTVRTALGK
jgi:hypothetical protein